MESIIVHHVPAGARSLLDAGAGQGERALRIAAQAHIPNVTLLEPSPAMRAGWPDWVNRYSIRLEQLSTVTAQFDLIVCLWNVLGHVVEPSARQEILCQFSRLLSPNGVLFLDVAHRYNARHYGLASTLKRCLQDLIRPDLHNGDVTATWSVAGGQIQSFGHVFTPAEMRRLIAGAGLSTKNRWSVNYRTGHISRSSWSGHLLYQLQVPAHRTPGSPAPDSEN